MTRSPAWPGPDATFWVPLHRSFVNFSDSAGVDSVLAFWSHAVGAVAFASVLIWQLRGWAAGPAQKLLLGGLLTTAAATWLAGVQPNSLLTSHAETARNLLWVTMLFVLSGSATNLRGNQRGLPLVYCAVALVLGIQAIVDSVVPFAAVHDRPALQASAILLRTIAAAGALILVHNLYGQAAAVSRGAIRLPMLGLALLWCYDLNLYTMAALGVPWAATFAEARGIAVAVAAPTFLLARRDSDSWRLKLSRAATFQSLSLLAICSYFAVMALLAAALRADAFDWLRGAAMLVLAAMTVGLAVLLPSRRARSWTKVKIAKHFFEHRYDYRTEWLRFAATVGERGSAEPLANRLVRAFADIMEAPAGLLLVPDEHSRMLVAGTWRWQGRLPDAQSGQDFARFFDSLGDGRVIEFDVLRRHIGSQVDLTVPLPAWLIGDERLWAGVPLVHGETVVGLVLLAPPELRRPLDWEDFDLLKTAGRQAASSLAEALSQQRLSEAQRFDEFNRRFAFILHDIKNLVSQLKLLSRNAERHADNPEFRSDMVATLKSSVGKMTDLLARLAPSQGGEAKPHTCAVALRPLLAGVLAAHRGHHEVRLLGDTGIEVLADALGLEHALQHLIGNAVDASPRTAPVQVRVTATAGEVRIEIVDQGRGMDADFVATRLFAPFASTKDGGFGIGAYEARSLIQAMGGRLGVDSRVDEGTRFTLFLPLAEATPLPHVEKLTA